MQNQQPLKFGVCLSDKPWDAVGAVVPCECVVEQQEEGMKHPILTGLFCLVVGFALVYSVDIYHWVMSWIR